MTIEQERLEVIRALTRIEDAALIRRVHRLVASDRSPSEEPNNGEVKEQAGVYVTDRMRTADVTPGQPPGDLRRFGAIEEKLDFERLKREQPRRKYDPEAFAKLADSLEWEHTIEELLAMVGK